MLLLAYLFGDGFTRNSNSVLANGSNDLWPGHSPRQRSTKFVPNCLQSAMLEIKEKRAAAMDYSLCMLVNRNPLVETFSAQLLSPWMSCLPISRALDTFKGGGRCCVFKPPCAIWESWTNRFFWICLNKKRRICLRSGRMIPRSMLPG